MNSLTTDLYELTMCQGYYENGMKDTIAYFDVFYRRAPDGAPFAIANGIAEIVDFVCNFKYSPEDIAYLSSINLFSKDFLNYISKLKFTGDLWAVADGTIIFPHEPVITIRAPIIEAQVLETSILQKFNHACLITTKANRIVRTACGIDVFEMGARRAQGEESAVYGALYAYEAGTVATSCLRSGKKFNIPVMGTMAHSYVQSFENEYDAFKTFAKTYPDDCVLLIDTYNTIDSGLNNAIKIYEKVLRPMGKTLKGVRIDSGDLAYLAKEARAKLDAAGLTQTKIVLSNCIDEFVIESLIQQHAPVDMFAVGEKLITAKSSPIFGGVYKLVAVEKNGKVFPKIKISDNYSKITLPDVKTVYRLYDSNKKIILDHVCLSREPKPTGKLRIKDTDRPWMMKDVNKYSVRELRFKFVENGKRKLKGLTPEQVRKNIAYEISTLPAECLRLHNPKQFPINVSNELLDIQEQLMKRKYD